MKYNLLAKLVLLTFTLIILNGCCSSNYMTVKVKKSAFIPDTYEINRDSLITGAIRICSLAQRFYNKDGAIGGGGNSFITFSIPLRLAKTDFGNYEVITKANRIKVIGKGKLNGYAQNRPMEVIFISNKDEIIGMTIVN